MKKSKLLLCLLIVSMIVVNITPSTLSYADAKNTIPGSRLIVEYKERTNLDSLHQSVKKKHSDLSFDVLEKLDNNMEVIQLNGDVDLNSAISCFENESNVELVQPDYIVSYNDNFDTNIPDDSYFNYQWGLHNTGQPILDYGVAGMDINVLPAWNLTRGNADVVIGVVDSGIDISHADLCSNVYINKNEIPNNNIDDDQNGFIDDVNGWDFANNDNTVYDNLEEDVHGTCVAGIIAAASNNGMGITGVAPNVKILPIKFLKGLNGYTSDAIKAIQYAEAMGVSIVNCSWGGEEYNKVLEKVMRKSRILFVCSSGNDGTDLDQTPIYPICFHMNNIIGVGSMNSKGSIESYSNYGKEVDLVAPGSYILSTYPGNEYAFGSGTSFAAPFVTGIAALAKSMDNSLKSNQLRNTIINNVVFDQKLSGKVKSPGRVDAFRVLSSIK